MDFNTQVKDLAKRSASAEQKALTEEATKTAVVLPFIKALGFDPFSLDEVVPEFIADVGLKKGEKVDFALKIEGTTTILVEVKPISQSLGDTQYSQLYRYFSVTDAKLAILTNGREAWFFSDIDEANRLDRKPFFTFNFQSFNQDEVEELARFQKEIFSIEDILEAASALKYSSKAATYLKAQMENPDDEFIKVIGRQIHEGMLTKSVVEQLRPAVQSAIDLIIRERIQDKLNIAFTAENAVKEPKAKVESNVQQPSDIVTTEEEIQAFMIVRAIAAKTVPIARVTMRDAKSYCSVFLDDNNRKPLCRFYFNSKSKNVLGVFDENKSEEKFELQTIEDIYEHAVQIEKTASSY